MTKYYTINIYKMTLIKIDGRKNKKKMFTKIDSYKHINAKELSSKIIETKKKYPEWNIYTDEVDEDTNICMIKEGLK